jgi:hypothetical protein
MLKKGVDSLNLLGFMEVPCPKQTLVRLNIPAADRGS